MQLILQFVFEWLIRYCVAYRSAAEIRFFGTFIKHVLYFAEIPFINGSQTNLLNCKIRPLGNLYNTSGEYFLALLSLF
jgi:hypothetical protein